ncbi:hypothetical protein SNEBB_004552 [Seison nebaliae]|nr:hypothetical protein SNEBB_004552 [Seison nebaliae]
MSPTQDQYTYSFSKTKKENGFEEITETFTVQGEEAKKKYIRQDFRLSEKLANTEISPVSFFTRTTGKIRKQNQQITQNVNFDENPDNSSTLSQFRNDMINQHNLLRRLHSAKSLRISNDLNDLAQKWADYQAKHKCFKHSNYSYRNKPVGENILYSQSSSNNFMNGIKATDSWYEEIANHRFEDSQMNTGHFTQVVWKSSEYIGIGRAVNDSHECYIVAVYFPAGDHQLMINIEVHPLLNDYITTFIFLRHFTNDNIPILCDKMGKEKNKLRNFRREMLEAHNIYRNRHRAPSLTMSKDLTRIAQTYAEILADQNYMKHSNNRWKEKTIGENLAMFYSGRNNEYTGLYATNQWYSEVEVYSFKNFFKHKCGHFSQLIWKSSRLIGIGCAQSKDGIWYAVANYFPPGNFIGKFQENVIGAPPVEY